MEAIPLEQRLLAQRMQQPATLACDGSIRAIVLHKRLTYDVLPRTGVIGAGTGNIIYCQRAALESATGQPKLPLAQVYHKTAFLARGSGIPALPLSAKADSPRAVAMPYQYERISLLWSALRSRRWWPRCSTFVRSEGFDEQQLRS